MDQHQWNNNFLDVLKRIADTVDRINARFPNERSTPNVSDTTRTHIPVSHNVPEDDSGSINTQSASPLIGAAQSRWSLFTDNELSLISESLRLQSSLDSLLPRKLDDDRVELEEEITDYKDWNSH